MELVVGCIDKGWVCISVQADGGSVVVQVRARRVEWEERILFTHLCTASHQWISVKVPMGCRVVSLCKGDIASVITFRRRLGPRTDIFSQQVDVAALYPQAEK
jgi:hypothetical protein